MTTEELKKLDEAQKSIAKYKLTLEMAEAERNVKAAKDLLVFPHFNAIEKSIHPLDEMLYLHARQFEIKQMKRVRAWIEIEEVFNQKYWLIAKSISEVLIDYVKNKK